MNDLGSSGPPITVAIPGLRPRRWYVVASLSGSSTMLGAIEPSTERIAFLSSFENAGLACWCASMAALKSSARSLKSENEIPMPACTDFMSPQVYVTPAQPTALPTCS